MKKHGLVFATLAGLGILLAWWLLFGGAHFAVLSPAGLIAQQEHRLLIFTVLLMLVIVVPVFVMTFFIAFKYREGNPHAKYAPTWDGSRLYESIWWGFPLLIIAVLSVVTWTSTHQLDPFRPLDSKTKPVTIQVVALQWRWLFIYPEQQIATINDLRFPEKTPIKFEITADAPMNSFWIPKLGGQMYAMTGMSTHLHLEASQPGSYRGSSANISGEGFAGMNFTATALTRSDFDAWVKKTTDSPRRLDATRYASLVLPSKDSRPQQYWLNDSQLYNKVVMKYMRPLPALETDDASHDEHSPSQMESSHGTSH